MTESKIQNLLWSRYVAYGSNICMLPNTNVLGWHECDFVLLKKSMFWHEFEIKVSKADYKNDFKKTDKHKSLKDRKFVQTRQGWTIGIEHMKKGFASYSHVYFKHLDIPNYFWFVTTFDDIEVPDYAGHILVINDSYLTADKTKIKRFFLREIKKAPRLHNRKLSNGNLLSFLNKINYRYWHGRLLKEY